MLGRFAFEDTLRWIDEELYSVFESQRKRDGQAGRLETFVLRRGGLPPDLVSPACSEWRKNLCGYIEQLKKIVPRLPEPSKSRVHDLYCDLLACALEGG